jgi:outer membrane protein assembly factor BamB
MVVAATVAACACARATPSASVASSPSRVPSASAVPSVSAVPPSVASPTAVDGPVTRVALSGQAPAALAIDGDRMWVYEIESGDLSLVDLTTERETRSIHFGGLGSHILLGRDGTIYVARFETGGSGDHLLIVDPSSGAIDGVATGPLGAMTIADDGSLLALEKADRLVRVDQAKRAIVGHVSVDIDDEHMEVVAAASAAWVASDHTPVRRISGRRLAVEATIDAGGGIPFVARDGLVWGARPDTLWALDPATNAISRTVPLENLIEILALDIDGDDAWIAARRPGHVGTLIRLDLGSGRVRAEYPVSLPSAVRIAGNRVWVASYLTNELLGFTR